jgi:hypothetical protein
MENPRKPHLEEKIRQNLRDAIKKLRKSENKELDEEKFIENLVCEVRLYDYIDKYQPRRVGKITIDREIAHVRKASKRLIAALNISKAASEILDLQQANAELTEKLLLPDCSLNDLLGRLLVFEDKARSAQEHSSSSENSDVPGGRRYLRAPRTAATLCAQFYAQKTGESPAVRTSTERGSKAYGPFLEFVSSVFAALELDARPEFYAREASSRYTRPG